MSLLDQDINSNVPCRCTCHKKGDILKHSSSHKQLYTGDDHWTKLFQTHDVHCDGFLSSPDNKRRSSHHSCKKHKHRHKHSKHSKHKTKNGEEKKDVGVFATLYTRFCKWVDTAKKNASEKEKDLQKMGKAKSEKELLHLPHLTQNSPNGHIHTTSLSSEDGDPWLCTSYSSTCSSLTNITVYSSSSVTSDYVFSNSSRASNVTTPTFELESLPLLPQQFAKDNDQRLKRRERASLCTDIGSYFATTPLKTNDQERLFLCFTWPQPGRKLYQSGHDHFDEADDDESCDESVFGDYCSDEESKNTNNGDRDISSVLRDTLGECSIRYNDLEFGDCIKTGIQGEIYRGHWHGEVIIHTYRGENENDLAQFWEEVSQLSLIRHENIALFMGACIEPPKLAVVTSLGKGCSLHDQIHVKQGKMNMYTKIHIARQIAQGLGYLHAKGIVMRFLNSSNIFLESKVKLSLMDYSTTDKKYHREGYWCIKRGHLTYLAPAILKTLQVTSEDSSYDEVYTKDSDVFAFGSVFYELLGGQFPFHGVHIESIIWQVVNNKRQSITHLKCSSSQKRLIEQCWEHNPRDRPDCSHINKELQHNTAIHKKHSSSEPEKLNRSGLSGLSGMSLFT